MKGPILIVDDDRDMVRTLCDIFRLRGWESLGAHSGEEAVEQQRQERHPVVLMDVKMPGMDGLTAFREMKRDTPGTRVILMTAYLSEDVRADAEREGAWRVIQKPVDLASLFALLG